jgi:hypothetical protein
MPLILWVYKEIKVSFEQSETVVQLIQKLVTQFQKHFVKYLNKVCCMYQERQIRLNNRIFFKFSMVKDNES